MSAVKRGLCLLGSLVLFGLAAATFIFLATRTHADSDGEIVGWSVLLSLSLACAAGYLGLIGLR